MNKLFYIILISIICCEARAVVSTRYVSSYTCENGAGVLSINRDYTTKELNDNCEELARKSRCFAENKDCVYCDKHQYLCLIGLVIFILICFFVIIFLIAL